MNDKKEVINDVLESEPPAPPGVLVTRVPTETGERLNISPVNGLDVLAVPAMLELAAKIARQNIGLS